MTRSPVRPVDTRQHSIRRRLHASPLYAFVMDTPSYNQPNPVCCNVTKAGKLGGRQQVRLSAPQTRRGGRRLANIIKQRRGWHIPNQREPALPPTRCVN